MTTIPEDEYDNEKTYGLEYDEYVGKINSRKIYGFPYMFISGPWILYYLNIEGKKIYMFGESHKDNPTCDDAIDYPSYIKTVLDAEPDKLIDVFHEFPYDLKTPESEKFRRQYFESKNTLFTIGKEFKDCFSAVKSNCKYNARFHYADIRFFSEIKVIQQASLKFDYKDLSFEEIDVLRSELKDHMLRIKELSSQETSDAMFWLEKSKAMKQFNAIRDPIIREKITSYWIRTVTNRLDNIYENIREPSGSIELDTYALHVSLVDAYTIGRMFRSYLDGPDSKNIIAYFGHEHIRNMIYCLYEIFGGFDPDDPIGQVPDDHENCLFIEDILVPPIFKKKVKKFILFDYLL